LADAGIPYVVDGLYFDFHALRHQTGTLLAAGEVHPKVAQSIMRHGDIDLTMSRYTHALTGQEAQAVEAMPDLSTSGSKQELATGTDNVPVNCNQNDSKKSTPKSTPTTYLKSNKLATNASSSPAGSGKSERHKPLRERKLDANREGLSPTGTDGKPICPTGPKNAVKDTMNRIRPGPRR